MQKLLHETLGHEQTAMVESRRLTVHQSKTRLISDNVWPKLQLSLVNEGPDLYV